MYVAPGGRRRRVSGNRGAPVLGTFFLNAVEFSEAYYLLGVLDASFIVLCVYK